MLDENNFPLANGFPRAFIRLDHKLIDKVKLLRRFQVLRIFELHSLLVSDYLSKCSFHKRIDVFIEQQICRKIPMKSYLKKLKLTISVKKGFQSLHKLRMKYSVKTKFFK